MSDNILNRKQNKTKINKQVTIIQTNIAWAGVGDGKKS